MSGILALVIAWWASADNNRYIVGVVTGIIVFTCILLCWAIFLWMKDRATRLDPNKQMPLPDCSWGTQLNAGALVKSFGNDTPEWQFGLVLRNIKPFPIQVQVVETELLVANIEPNWKLMSPDVPMIVPPGEQWFISLPGYRSGTLPPKDRYQGTLGLTLLYGHAGKPYTRRAIYDRQFTALSPHFPAQLAPMQGVALPIPLRAVLAPTAQVDTDEPY
jgi:hypothetical protein